MKKILNIIGKKLLLFLLGSLLLFLVFGSALAKKKNMEEDFKTIDWDALLPPDFKPEFIMEKYKDDIASIQDGTPEGMKIYEKLMKEINNAPPNFKMKDKRVRIPGYIAPLKVDKVWIKEFLLVPYFGQCIHSPPPPVNQTVLVKVKGKRGIHIDDSMLPYWVSGKIEIDKKKTLIGTAGYIIDKAVFEVYSEPSP